MSNQLKRKKFNLIVVNSDGNIFKYLEWKKSETYSFKEQSKLIISDKFSRIYSDSDDYKKKLIRKNVWGIN